GHVEPQVFLVEQPHDDLFAPERGQGGDAVVELFLLSVDGHFEHDAAVLRQALLADVELGHDLDARSDGVFQFHGRRHDGLQHAVNAEADAVLLLVRLHVDVAGAALDRVGKDEVDELDDGRFVGGPFQVFEGEFFFVAGGKLDIGFGLADGGHDLFQVLFLGGAVRLLDAGHDRAFRGDDGLDVEAGHELDVVHGEDIRGVHHGDGQRRADAAERQDLIALGGFVGDELDHRRVNFEVGEIDGRHAVLAGEEVGNLFVGEEAQLDQHGSEAPG